MKLVKNAAMPLEDCLKLADETKGFILKSNALEQTPALLDKFFEGKTPCLIADENTMKAAGYKTAGIIESSGVKIAGAHIFPGEPRLRAEYDHARFLVDWISSLSACPSIVPVAIGTGAINDLAKRAAFELALPYLCVPTAASVDGFTSSGAALIVDGFKQTLPCPAPLAVAADTEVIACAPAFLSSSGLGDLAGKIIAGVDWIVAEKAGEAGAPEAPPIDPVCWAMIQNGLSEALNCSINAPGGDSEAVNELFRSLAITGFAMQRYKNSRPVSGAEHHLSHVWEMEGLAHNGVPVSHGHKVSMGTLAATAFAEILFAAWEGPPEAPAGYRQPSREEWSAEVFSAFKNSPACGSIIKTAMEKFIDQKTTMKINRVFRDSWKEIRDRVMERLIPYGELKALFEKAKCPVVPEEIGLTRLRAIASIRKARMIRNKYCIFDLAWDLGNFESALSKLEASNIYLR